MRWPVQNWSRRGNYFGTADAVWVHGCLRFERGAWMWKDGLPCVSHSFGCSDFAGDWALLLELRFLARSARWRACERTSLSRVLTLIGRQYEGPDLTPLTYLLNNSETTCSKRFFHADFKLKEFCNGYFHLVLSVPVPMKKIKTKTKKQTLFYRCKMETQGLWSSVVLCPGAPCLEQSSSPHPTQLLPLTVQTFP